MKLNPNKFNRHLNKIGQQVRWYQSFSCNCVNPATGSPDPKHRLCGGKGRIWKPAVDTVIGIAHQGVDADWKAPGLIEAGDMVASVPESSPMWSAGQFDRVVLINSTDVFSQPFVRGGPAERIIFAVKQFTRVFWTLKTAPDQIIEGDLPTIDAVGNLVWATGSNAPPAGVAYSLTGEKYDEYFIFGQFPSDRNEHSGARLPKKIILRKWDLMNRSNPQPSFQ